MLHKKIIHKKIFSFHAYSQVSKNNIVFSYDKKSKICVSMHFDFNDQFIKVMRTRPTFQKKNLKKLFCLLLIPGITNLHVRRTPYIKISFFC